MAFIQSWSEFAQLDKHHDLYPSAISACKTKVEEWEKTTEHRQQDAKLAEDLVTSIEAICLNVADSWSSSLSSYNHQKKESQAKADGSALILPVNPDPKADAKV